MNHTNLNYNVIYPYIYSAFAKIPTRTHNPSIVEYAETTIVPAGKYRGLQFSHSRSPQLKEPLSLLSPDSPYREIVMMTPAQWGKSTLAELVTMYYITQVPSEIIYISSNETAAIKWLERRIVPRASAAGIQFRTEVETRTSRKTGDTTYSKIFPGGNIDIASALSPAQLAQETKRIALGDEVDRWKIMLGDQGSVLDQIRARTQAWGNQAKILWISTPTTEDASVINQLFLMGDQRFYHVPCPHCGYMQLLDFSYGKSHGLHWQYKDGHVDRKSIVLVCESGTCAREIRESSKNRMLNGGEWRKSAIPQYDFIASFNSNGLYSPMLSWYEMVISYEESIKGPMQKQSFENLKMGRIFKEIGTRPKVEKLIQNRGSYASKQVEPGVLYLTAGIDVQEGKKNDEGNPPRLEMGVLGTGAGYRTWGIEYHIFPGDVYDPYAGAWEALHQYALETELTYYRKDGFKFPISLIFIDSGDLPDVVYRFCQRWQNTFPSKGFKYIHRRKTEKPDEVTEGNFKRYRAAKMNEETTLYEINTNYYKTIIYHNLRLDRVDHGEQRPGFCSFPVDYGDRYFFGLTSEEKHRDGSFHNTAHKYNEPLDVMVMGFCAADVYLDSELLNLRAWAKQQGWPVQDIQKITHRTVIESMAEQTAIKKPLATIF